MQHNRQHKWTILKAICSMFLKQTIHQWKAYLFSFQIMYKSNFFFFTKLPHVDPTLTGFVVQGHKSYDCVPLTA